MIRKTFEKLLNLSSPLQSRAEALQPTPNSVLSSQKTSKFKSSLFNSKNGSVLFKEEFVVIMILLFISSVAAFQGISDSYMSDTKIDFGISDNATSSSFTGRVISGFEPVGNYSSGSYDGRFGILTDITETLPINTPSINSTDGTNQSNRDLNCILEVTDPNARQLNVSVKWYKNAIEYETDEYNNNYANGTSFVGTLEYGNTTRGENWTCSMRIFNGYFYSNWSSPSENLTITNSPPTVTLDNPFNASFTTNVTPMFNWTGYDEDGDMLYYDFNISLVPASLCTDSDQFVENSTDETYTVSPLSCYYDNGDYYQWSVRAKDNYSVGDWADYFDLRLSIIIDLSLPTSSVSFGNIPFLGSNNTTDNSPQPFVIQNNGNTFVNINVTSTDLWNAVSNPTSYYKLKVDNVSGEEGSFNWTASSTSWVNAPATNDTLFISKLNDSDATDSAELDIYVSVPTNETPSAKSANVTFIGSYAG